MLTALLDVLLDVAEPRLALFGDRLGTLVDGRDWDLPNCVGCTRDAVTKTGMLTPLPMTPEWPTITGGAYYRLHKEDYQLADPSKWVNHDIGPTGNVYLQSQGAGPAYAVTFYKWPRNQGFYLSWFAYNQEHESFVQVEAGHADGSGVNYKFWSDGKVEVYLGGAKFGEGSITRLHEELGHHATYKPVHTGHEKGADRNLGGKYVSVLILPCRGRDILFLTPSEGGGFVWTNELIDEADPDPTITPPGVFYWRVPTGQATVQCAPLRFSAAGFLLGPAFAFRTPPPPGYEQIPTVYYHPPGYGSWSGNAYLVLPDGVTPFVANGTNYQARLRIDLFGDSTNTPSIYGAADVFPGTLAYTDASHARSLLPYLAGDRGHIQLDVPESPTDVRLSLPIRFPGQLNDTGSTGLSFIENRAVSAGIGSAFLLNGRTEPPEYKEGINDAARELTLKCRDWWKALEDYRFQDFIPYDGWNLSDALADLVMLAGFPPTVLDIDPIDFWLPTVGGSSLGDWALRPEPGDTAAQWITKLWETFASIWFHGWVPTAQGVVFRFRNPWDLPTVPSAAVYTSSDSAPRAVYNWVRTLDHRVLGAEANDIWVTGRNPRTNKPIVAHYADFGSQDPTIPVPYRPANWLGVIRRYAFTSESITTQQAADWCALVLALRLTGVREMVEWECEFLLKTDGSPVWRGDCVWVEGWGRYRVISLSAAFSKEPLRFDPMQWRSTKYVGERLGD